MGKPKYSINRQFLKMDKKDSMSWQLIKVKYLVANVTVKVKWFGLMVAIFKAYGTTIKGH
jgi:hypothetical protein